MGLHLERKVGQSIIIDKDITLVVSEIKDNRVTLSFDFPNGSFVFRKELVDKARSNGTEDELYSKVLL